LPNYQDIVTKYKEVIKLKNKINELDQEPRLGYWDPGSRNQSSNRDKTEHELRILNCEIENLKHLSKPYSSQEALQEIQTRSDLSDKDYECLLMIVDRKEWEGKYHRYIEPCY
jgi:hypothetical protein